MRFAAIDIGTNTINLLIAEAENGVLKVIEQEKIGAKLGKGGIQQGFITPEAMKRGMKALSLYMVKIKSIGVDKILAVATSAVRNASNGNQLVVEAKRQLDLDIRVVDGMEESRLIFLGVKNGIPPVDQPYLVLDIGGGSCEFILAHKSNTLWQGSFETGMARMLDLTGMADPLTNKEIAMINDFTEKKLQLFFEAEKRFKPKILIGSSGSFDTLAAMMLENFPGSVSNHKPWIELPDHVMKYFSGKLIFSTLAQRKIIPGMDPVRVEYMAVAMHFIHYLLAKMNIEKIYQTSFAIKEGIIFDYLDRLK